jgi:hypothetical protein
LDRLQNILKETRLLAEVKDISDEIKIIMTVLQAQRSVIENNKLLNTVDSSLCDEVDEAVKGNIAEFQVMKSHAEEIHVSVCHLSESQEHHTP